ncbi:GlsB/YeaQ/YmgE family stress response membrane protein [Asanoa sp. NPDC050611]|uniref:GlsB/YeaQ/YmgE family stress response membrane protein n=1 Tax=Asanoa sp. NPDC050611 TaxID=3157098 RepID=UPI0033F3B578
MIATLLWALIGGVIIGALARLILPGRQYISIWATITIGFIAALVGGVIADLLGVGETRGIDWIRHGIQIGLAILFVWIFTRLAARDAAKRSLEQ